MKNSKPYKKGIAFGVFDIFHIGHLRYLQQSASLCEELYVGVRSDALKTPGKNRSTFFDQEIRCELIRGLKCVYEAFVFNVSLDDAFYWVEFFKKNAIDIVFVGEDWKNSDRWKTLKKLLNQNNITVKFFPRTNGISSSGILGQANRD